MKVEHDDRLIEINELEEGFYFIIGNRGHEIYPIIKKGELEKRISDLKSRSAIKKDVGIKVKGPFEYLHLVIQS